MENWNYFFSALAQCNATIIGFFGGFIIIKILNMENERSVLEHSITEVKIDIFTQLEKLNNIPFSLYNNIRFCQTLIGNFYKSLIMDSIKFNSDSKDVKDSHLSAVFSNSSYDSINRIYDIARKDIEKMQRENAQSKPFVSSWFNGLGYVYSNNDKDETFCKETQKIIEEETIKTRRLADKTTEILKLIQNFPRNKEIIIFTLLFLCILFITGVIFPLIFLPISNNSVFNLSTASLNIIKFLMLCYSIGLFFSIITVFFIRVSKLEINKTNVEFIKRYKDYSCFSRYMKFHKEWENRYTTQ